jgi:hypothetical protein
MSAIVRLTAEDVATYEGLSNEALGKKIVGGPGDLEQDPEVMKKLRALAFIRFAEGADDLSEVMETLLDTEQRPDVLNAAGKTPLTIARRRGPAGEAAVAMLMRFQPDESLDREGGRRRRHRRGVRHTRRRPTRRTRRMRSTRRA